MGGKAIVLKRPKETDRHWLVSSSCEGCFTADTAGSMVGHSSRFLFFLFLLPLGQPGLSPSFQPLLHLHKGRTWMRVTQRSSGHKAWASDEPNLPAAAAQWRLAVGRRSAAWKPSWASRPQPPSHNCGCLLLLSLQPAWPVPSDAVYSRQHPAPT